MSQHKLSRTADGGYRCTRCGKTWRGRPVSACRAASARRVRSAAPARPPRPCRQCAQRPVAERGLCAACLDRQRAAEAAALEARRERDRLAAVEEARWLLAQPHMVIIDTETTGFGRDAEVIQVAIVDRQGATLLNQLFRPDWGIPAQASRIHGITEQRVRHAPQFRDCYGQIARLLRGRLVIAFNVRFDRRMLEQECAQWGLDPFAPADWACAMQLLSCYVGDWQPRRGRYRPQPLPGRTHDAAADCRAALNVLRHVAGYPPYRWPEAPRVDVAVDDDEEWED